MFSKKKKDSVPGKAPTYVGNGMKIEGKIWGVRAIWVDGEVRGTIDCGSEVMIGPTAKVHATIRASTIKVNGIVEGELFASERMEVLPEGRIKGNITNLPGSLISHEGGFVEGQCLTASESEMKNLLPKEQPKLLIEDIPTVKKKIAVDKNKPQKELPNSASNTDKDNSKKDNKDK